MKNAIDITDMTDAALDVVLAARSGADYVDCEGLTPKERYQVAEALGWEMNARTRYWIDSAPSSNAVAGPVEYPLDYEGMILDQQEDFYA